MAREEAAQQRRQELARRGSVGEKAHPAAQPLGELREVAAHLFELLRDEPGVMDQRQSGGRRCDAAALALEQRHAQRLLHVADALARRSEGEATARRAMGDAGRLGDIQDQLQVDQVESHGSK